MSEVRLKSFLVAMRRCRRGFASRMSIVVKAFSKASAKIEAAQLLPGWEALDADRIEDVVPREDPWLQ